ncbi:MAG: DUF58 domain-containing protein [Herbinix sp.]|nr:DUF58 domain-containing protein [Herbinix sp.]
MSILYNIYYMGIILLTVIIMPFLLFGLLSYSYGKIKADLVCIMHLANKGDAIPITVQFHNPTIFPVSCVKIYFTYKNAYSSQKFKRVITASLDYRTKTSVICNLYSQYAGNLEVTLEAIRFYDYLMLFSLEKKLKGELKIAVLPSYCELSDNEILSQNTQLMESDHYSPVKKGDDPTEVFEIREYREGDRLQRIHWKLSRKQNQLMIKEFSDPLNYSILLFVNFSALTGNSILFLMDAILESALSISYTFLRKGQLHYFSWYDEKHGVCRRVRITQEKDLYEAVDGLLQAMPYSQTIDAMSYYLAEFPHDQYSDLFFVTGEISMPWSDSLSFVKANNRQMIYMRDQNHLSGMQQVSQEVLQHYGAAGVNLWPVDIGSVRSDMEQFGFS